MHFETVKLVYFVLSFSMALAFFFKVVRLFRT